MGGTAIALQIGHRRSIDFDLFTDAPVSKLKVKRIIDKHCFSIQHLLYEDKEQMHLIVNHVKLTFFHYPYIIPRSVSFEKYIKMPSLLDLAAMKMLALGGKAKWKDYVDIYFLLKLNYCLQDIADRAKILFGGATNVKLFREQLSYFKDIDFSEEVEYLPSFEVTIEEIQDFLIKAATEPF